MGIIIASQQQIDEYFESSDVNQSTLKSLIPGFDSFIFERNKEKVEKEYFLIGGAVDTILTGEVGEFEKQYYVSKLDKKPSEVEMNIINSVFNELVGADVIDQVDFEDCDDTILAAANEFSWQRNWKEQTRIDKLKVAGAEYFEDLKNSLGLKILTMEMKIKIDSIVMSLTSNPKTKKYFDREMQAQQENMDFYYQLPIYFTYEGIACKALMDLVVVHKDENGNIIKIEPIDLKTMSGNTLQFSSKIRQHRYDIQAAWYIHALIEYFNVTAEDIQPFKFVVESTTNVGTPLVFKISNDTLIHGQIGAPAGEFRAVDKIRTLFYPEVKGYEQLMKEYLYYNEQGFEQDKILDDNPDVIEIDWYKGIL